MKYELTKNLIFAIKQLLSTRPYQEVAQIINKLDSELLPQIQKEEKNEKKKWV